LNNNGTEENSNNENDDDDETISAQINENEQILFSGFDSLYENLVALEDQILCKEFQDEAGEKYER